MSAAKFGKTFLLEKLFFLKFFTFLRIPLAPNNRTVNRVRKLNSFTAFQALAVGAVAVLAGASEKEGES